MWTSYEAICELGGPAGKPDEADDPNSIFGVDPPKLSPRNMEAIAGMQHSFKVGKSNNNAATTSDADDASQQVSFALNRFGTPSTPYSTFDKMTIGIHQTTNSRFASAKGRESDIHNHLNRPATGSTVAPRSRATGSEAGLPQTNLFNATPATAGATSFRSPILETPAAKTPGTGNTAVPASAIGYADSVLNKARRVASGLYYEASPESTNPRRVKSPHSTADSRFNDLSAIPDATKLSFANLPTTPNVPPPFHAGVSSVKGEKRALSPMEMESRKKFGQEKRDGDTDDDEKAVLKPEEELVFNQEMERNSVGRVLQMLSTFGAAYKYLCQVS